MLKSCEIICHPSIQQDLKSKGFSALPSSSWSWPDHLKTSADQLAESWSRLEADQFMGDGGKYRFRRYSRFEFHRSGTLIPASGNSIHQLREHNPLNGGVTRTYAPLEPEILNSPALEFLIRHDIKQLGLEENPTAQRWVVGIHQVRILAELDSVGLPTPEGVHIDAETYTVQHLLDRQNIRGGVFSAYDSQKQPVFHWLQLNRWDSVFFTGSTWHSATPLQLLPNQARGHRDILLIDFDPYSES